MASYFGASEMQSDGLQTLYLMNPGYPGYSGETQTPSANMIYLNSAGNQLNQGNLPHPNRQNQQLVGIPVQAQRATSQDPNRPSLSYNLWTPINPSMAVATAQNTHQIASTAAGDGRVIADMASQLGLRRLSDGLQPVVPSQRGLSLSLSPQKKPAYGGYRSETDIAPAEISPGGGDDMRVSGSSSSVSAVSNGISSLQSVLTGSKYLKAAQQLLDEVVNVGNGFKSDDASKGAKGQMKANGDSPLMEASGGGEVNGKTAAELTTAERQEIQMKKAKLINMLDEVEQRYRQYHQQMQIVISAFEATAGIGSAKTYTALALKTISKQFRCLRDAIVRQIRAVSTRLGEEDCFGGGKMEGSSRLRLVDQHLRQQRALQQLSMMQQHNAWRPQRGLPERSVSVLRAWLFEHFLHPYPKDSDKVMLAKQTGLTRSQVSNWFINARVRLWKPMIEEMYLEETKEQEENGSNDKASKSEISGELASTTQESSAVRTEQINNVKAKSTNINDPLSNLPSTASTSTGNAQPQACFSLMGSSYAQASFRDNEGTLQGNRKKTRTVELQNLNTIASMEADLRSDNMNSDKEFYMKFSGERSNRDDYYSITGTAGQDSGFGAYQIGEMGRFDPEQFAPRFSGSGVSLTLGLPHCEKLSLSGAQQTYLPNQNIPLGTRLEMGNESNDFGSMNTPSVAHSADAYESINIQNRKQFATQLFPDFVA